MVASIAVTVALGWTAVAAQTTKPTKAMPGPEQKRIAYFVGQWKFEGEAKDSPFGPGGKISATETCEWFAGGFQLVCRTKGTSPKGVGTGMSVLGYDPGRKAYTFHAISSHGDNIFARGQVQDKVWTWTDEATMEGKKVKIVATVTEDSPTSSSLKVEVSVDGGPMMVIEQGKSTKVGKSTSN
jgi:hypothetical protein